MKILKGDARYVIGTVCLIVAIVSSIKISIVAQDAKDNIYTITRDKL